MGFSYGMASLRYQFTEGFCGTDPVLKEWIDLYQFTTNFSMDMAMGLENSINWMSQIFYSI